MGSTDGCRIAHHRPGRLRRSDHAESHPLRQHPLHRLPPVRGCLRRALGPALRRRSRPGRRTLRPQAHGGANPRRALLPSPLHALPRPHLRLGLPGGRLAEDPVGADRLRRKPLHRLPLLHAGLPLPGARLHLGQPPAGRQEVRYVLRPAEGRAADRLRGSLPDRRHPLRRTG